MTSLFIEYFFSFFSLLFILYLVGIIPTFLLFKSEDHLNYKIRFVFSIFISIISFVLIYACFKTSFRTSQLSIFFVLFYLYKERNLNSKSDILHDIILFHKKNGLKLLFFISAVSIFCFSFIFLNFVDSSGIYTRNADSTFYANVSMYITNFNVENYMTVHNEYFGKSQIMLYHYTELWFNSIVFKLFRLNPLQSLLLILLPISYLLSVVGLCSFVSIQSRYRYIVYLVILWAFPYWDGTCHWIQDQLHFISFTKGNQSSEKLILLLPLFILIIHSIQNNKQKLTIALMTLLPVLNILFLPPSFILVAYLIYKNKKEGSFYYTHVFILLLSFLLPIVNILFQPTIENGSKLQLVDLVFSIK